MKILFLPNWRVYNLSQDNQDLKDPDKLINNKPYWFFKHWPDDDLIVDIIDCSTLKLIESFEKNLLHFHVIQALKAIFRVHNYDIIVSHGAQSAAVLSFLRSFLNRKQPPHVIIDVGCLNAGRSSQPELAIFQFAMHSVAGVIYHAKQQKQHYSKYFPSLVERSFYVPFGVDPNFFSPQKVSSENYILSIGYKFRDWDTLISAFTGIKEDIKLKIVGPSWSREKIKNLPANISHYNYMPIALLRNFVAKARFILIPLSTIPYATGQMTLLQAMAMSKAVIVPKVPGIIDYINDGDNGLFVNPNDVFGMRKKIEYLLYNTSEAERIGKNARQTIETYFNEKNMAASIYRALKKIIQLSR